MTAGRKIRAPKAFDGDPFAARMLLDSVVNVAELVECHTDRDADAVMESVMRLVGHLCEKGERHD